MIQNINRFKQIPKCSWEYKVTLKILRIKCLIKFSVIHNWTSTMVGHQVLQASLIFLSKYKQSIEAFWVLDIAQWLVRPWYFGRVISLSEPVSSFRKPIIDQQSVLEVFWFVLHNLQVPSIMEREKGNYSPLCDIWQAYFMGNVVR